MKKIFYSVTVALVFLVPAVFVFVKTGFAAPDICSWTGAVDSSWSNGGNWTGCDNGGVPENGDALVFPVGASNKATNNDLVGLSVLSLTVLDSGYSFNGNAIDISSSGVSIISSEDTTVNFDISFSGFNPTIAAQNGRTITINGNVNFSGVGGEVNIGNALNSGTVDIYGNITGSAAGQFIVVESARVIVRGGSNTYTTAQVGAESNAVFECRSTTCFGGSSNDIFMAGGTVSIYVSAVFSNDWLTSAPIPQTPWLNVYENVTISGSGLVDDPLGVQQLTPNRDLLLTGPITLTNSMSLFSVDQTANVRVDGNVSGTGGISFGGGNFRLGGTNTYTGTNTVNSGSFLTVTNTSGLGSNSGITNVLNGATLDFSLSSSGTVDEPVYINGNGLSGAGAIRNSNQSTTLDNTVTLSGSSTVVVTNAFLNFDGVISGTGDLTIQSADTSNYASLRANNTYSGTTTVYGAVGLDATGAIPGDLVLMGDAIAYPSASNVVDGKLIMSPVGLQKPHWDQPNPYTNTFTEISGDGSVLIDGGGSIITFNQNTDSTYAGSFTGSGGVINKTGTGSLTHTGTCSDSAKVIDVQQGTLILDTSSNSCQYYVNADARLKAKGVAGSIIVASGGAYSPGSSPGCNTLSSLTLNSGSTYTQDIAGLTPCSEYDQATVSGTASLGNATLNVVLTTTPADGAVFTIITAGSVAGTFNGLPDNAVFTVSGVQFRINYTLTSVVLTKLGGTYTPSSGLANTGTNTALIMVVGFALVAAATRSVYRSRRYRA